MDIPTNQDEYIDAAQLVTLVEDWEAAMEEGADEDGEIQLPFGVGEYPVLKKVADEIVNYGGDKDHEQLVREDCFLEYTKQLVDDCYGGMKSRLEDPDGKVWPWRHMTMDWEAAAAELKGDYVEIDFDGVTYYMRSG